MTEVIEPKTVPAVKQDADYVFYELTRSICPECRRVIDAHILLRDNKVYMRKRCPRHGQFEGLVYGDAEAYTAHSKFNKPGTIPLKFSTEIDRGCPTTAVYARITSSTPVWASSKSIAAATWTAPSASPMPGSASTSPWKRWSEFSITWSRPRGTRRWSSSPAANHRSTIRSFPCSRLPRIAVFGM